MVKEAPASVKMNGMLSAAFVERVSLPRGQENPEKQVPNGHHPDSRLLESNKRKGVCAFAYLNEMSEAQ